VLVVDGCHRRRRVRPVLVHTPAGQKVVPAHRFVLAAVHGGLVAIEDQTALHWCDVPLCVRAFLQPNTHLLLGTASENRKDRALKG
jgi:hypothetical protein